MITRTAVLRQTPAWQRELAQAVTDPAQLLTLLELSPDLLPGALAAQALFPLRVPRPYLARMRKGDAHDPLLRQVLPLAAEGQAAPGFDQDPVGDGAATVAPGVLHKYQGRVLLTATGACAVHCRYCFRRHYPYADANPMSDHWRGALEYIAADPGIHEVILSGGDPLTLSDQRLAEFAGRLQGIPHLRRLRIHTRLPIVLPARVDAALLEWLGRTRLQVVVVVHANHANEIDETVQTACRRLAGANAALLNQSVLLRGVNDSAQALADLSEALFSSGVLPYYLHQLDRVAGAAHFEVSDAAAGVLMSELNARLPGYLVPRLVREVPGAPAKQWLI